MRYLLDTDTCIHMLNGRHPEIARKLSSLPASQVALSAIVWFELMFGAAKSSSRGQVEQRLRILGRQFTVLPFDEAASEAAAQVRADLEQTGKSIGAFDTLIAGHALAMSATLVTHNIREFRRVRRLRLTDWVAS